MNITVEELEKYGVQPIRPGWYRVRSKLTAKELEVRDLGQKNDPRLWSVNAGGITEEGYPVEMLDFSVSSGSGWVCGNCGADVTTKRHTRWCECSTFDRTLKATTIINSETLVGLLQKCTVTK